MLVVLDCCWAGGCPRMFHWEGWCVQASCFEYLGSNMFLELTGCLRERLSNQEGCMWQNWAEARPRDALTAARPALPPGGARTGGCSARGEPPGSKCTSGRTARLR